MNSASILINSLGDLSKQLYKTDSIDAMMRVLQREIASLFGFNSTWLYVLKDKGERELTSQLVSASGKKKVEIQSVSATIDICNDKMSQCVFANEDPVYILDARIDPMTNKDIVNALDLKTIINCQMFMHGESIGAIGTGSFANEGVRDMSIEEINYFYALSNIVSISLDRIGYREESLIDSLTGIENKRGLKANTQKFLSLAQRNNKKAAVVYIDLDNFKEINDQHGHDFGDEALITFSQVLKNILRESDVKARVGGDEFVLLLSDITDDKCIKKVIDYINSACILAPLDDDKVQIKFSAGYAIFPEDSTNFDELINIADKRMYQVKATSKKNPISSQH